MNFPKSACGMQLCVLIRPWADISLGSTWEKGSLADVCFFCLLRLFPQTVIFAMLSTSFSYLSGGYWGPVHFQHLIHI